MTASSNGVRTRRPRRRKHETEEEFSLRKSEAEAQNREERLNAREKRVSDPPLAKAARVWEPEMPETNVREWDWRGVSREAT